MLHTVLDLSTILMKAEKSLLLFHSFINNSLIIIVVSFGIEGR